MEAVTATAADARMEGVSTMGVVELLLLALVAIYLLGDERGPRR